MSFKVPLAAYGHLYRKMQTQALFDTISLEATTWSAFRAWSGSHSCWSSLKCKGGNRRYLRELKSPNSKAIPPKQQKKTLKRSVCDKIRSVLWLLFTFLLSHLRKPFSSKMKTRTVCTAYYTFIENDKVLSDALRADQKTAFKKLKFKICQSAEL